MKQTLIALLFVLTFGTVPGAMAKYHRHTPRTEAVHHTPKSSTQAAQTADKNSKDKGIEAFSDTTSTDDAAEDTAVVDTTYTSGTAVYSNDWNDTPWFLKAVTGTLGIGAVIFALLIVVLVFLFLIAPFIIIVLVLRYLIRKHNDKVMLTEKAIESGRPIPSVVKSQAQYRYSNEQQWQRGVKTAATGLGLMFLFAFLGAEELIGVGALILCMGAGQMIIVKTSRKKDTETHDDFSDEMPEFTEEKDAEEASNNDETHPQDK